MKHVSTSKVLMALTALLLLAAFGAVLFVWPSDRTVVRNLSGQTITDVVLQLRDPHSTWGITKRVARLEPGESLKVRHSHNDPTAVVEFAIGERRFRHDEKYVDLWTGEGYRFEIQPDGTVKAGYDDKERH